MREHVQIVLADRSLLSQDYEIGIYSERRWRVLDLSAKHALLRAGLGWGGMPIHVVADDLAKKRLVRLHIEEAGSPTFEAALFAIHRTAEPPGPAARWLIERLAEACKGVAKRESRQAAEPPKRGLIGEGRSQRFTGGTGRILPRKIPLLAASRLGGSPLA